MVIKFLPSLFDPSNYGNQPSKRKAKLTKFNHTITQGIMSNSIHRILIWVILNLGLKGQTSPQFSAQHGLEF
jgi:hypothetical protein